jgi:dTDP-4-dehydrorhamnose 3,5-epimerase
MRVERLAIPDVLVIEPPVFADVRGEFFETWHLEKYRRAGIPDHFVQDNQSRSRRGVLRGLHAQRRSPQAKLVRAVVGEIFDVAVDARPGSATVGRWVGVRLSATNRRQCYVPAGFLHGFCVLSEAAEVEYKCSTPYAPDDELGVVWHDPSLRIDWPIIDPIVSARDAALPTFAEAMSRLRR